jgi:lysophospholipase L1-like esterase
MHQILVYADSLSWGIIPGTRKRLAFPDRWPGVMEHELLRLAFAVRVIEDCLNGRRTVWDDPFKPGRNGLVGLEQRIEINSPLALVMILLGSNDFQSMHHFNAVHSAQGVKTLVDGIRRAPIEPGMPIPEILLIAPPRIRAVNGPLAAKFTNADVKSAGLNDAIRDVATESKCGFFDAVTVTTTSDVDGVHLDQDQHKLLGMALAGKVASMLRA